MSNTNVNKQHRGPGGGPGGVAMVGEKAKNFKASSAKLLNALKPFKWSIIFSLIFAILSSVLTVIAPSILGEITNMAQDAVASGTSVPLHKVLEIGVILVAMYVLAFLFNTTQNFMMTTTAQKLSKQIRTNITEKINRLPLNYFDRTSFGDLLSRVTNDVDTVSQSISTSLISMVTSFITLIGITVMMFIVSWQLALITIIIIPLSLMVMGIIIKSSQKYFKQQVETLGTVNGHIEEMYSAHNIVRAFNGEKRSQEQFNTHNKALYTSTFKSQFLSGLMMPLLGFIGDLGYIGIAVVGGILVLQGVIGLGTITSFVIYSRQYNQPLRQIGSITNTLQSTVAAAERVFEFLEEPEEVPETVTRTLTNVQGNVTFEHVSFGYTKNKEIIHDFSFEVKAGEKVAIVGPTGAGKTTLVNLLMRFYELNKGAIYIDGINITDVSRGNLRECFGMVLQDTWLFEGTLLENLKFARPEATMEEIVEAAKASNTYHLIKSQSGGFDMLITEDTSLSAGEKQLLTITRAMVENAPMLILDEATSSVDTRTEQLIQDAMDRLTQGRTSFVIAHRLSTIKNADKIIVMKDGNIVETGNHESLLKQNGVYAQLYQSQFSKEATTEAV